MSSPDSGPTRQDAEGAMLRAARAFGNAHDRMSGGMKGDMGMNATDIAALRMLIMSAERGEVVSPADMARHLRISTASMTKLLDRLSASGHVKRLPHPTDRRSRIVVLTQQARDEFMALFRKRLDAMRIAMADYSEQELWAAASVLNAISTILEEQD